MNTFYFVAYTNKEKTAITVIDLDHCVNYELFDSRYDESLNEYLTLE